MIYRIAYKLLRESPAVVDRVADRIYARQAPANVTGEHIVISVVGSTAHNHLQNEAAVGEREVQFSFYADTPSHAESGFELIRMRLSGLKGVVELLDPQGSLREYNVESTLIRPGDTAVPPQDASDRWSHQHSGDFQLFYEQDVPTHV